MGVPTASKNQGQGPGHNTVQARPEAEVKGRHPDCWAAYGRFLFASIRARCHNRVVALDDTLVYFRRRHRNIDFATVYAYQECNDCRTNIWTTATRALETLSNRFSVDTLNLHVAGTVPPADADGKTLHTVLHGRYTALAMPHETRDILELGESFEAFLKTLGHSNRRHMKARHKEAVQAGLQFSISSNPAALGAHDRFELALISRPVPYPRDLVDAFDATASSKPGFFHASLRSPDGLLLSYCCGFIEADTSVILYQFNRKDLPKLSLTMTLRSFLIQHWAGTRVNRIVFPMGLAGHLTHAATTNPIARIFFLRRSPVAAAKALLMSILVPTSDASRMVRTKGFLMHFLRGGPGGSKAEVQKHPAGVALRY
ncbi:MAG: hypothetical protein ACYDBZ_19870 [Steroidobacteraceae bacterium]